MSTTAAERYAAARVDTALCQVRQGLSELRQAPGLPGERERWIRVGRCLEALRCAEANLQAASEACEKMEG